MRLALGLELQDRDPRLEVGRLHVDAQPPAEPADQALLHARELVRRPVGRDHDLPAGAVEVVERVEELGLRLLALGQELDVVDEQDVDLAVRWRKGSPWRSRTALMNSVTNCSEVTYFTRSARR